MADDEIVETGSDAGGESLARAEAAERKLAFVEAGIDYNAGPGALLFKSYDGDLSADAVKASALEFGVLKVEPEPKGPEIGAEEASSSDLRRATNTGAAPDDTSEDPRTAAVEAGFTALKSRPREDAIVAGIRVLTTAAKAGDQRVLPGAGGR